jgi:hypothetical protein
MRLNTPIVGLNHQRAGDCKLIDCNDHAQRDGNRKRCTTYQPANQALVGQAGDVFYPHGFSGDSPYRQKSDSSRYSQHQERSIFDLIHQFSECVTTEALRSVCDRLAYASRALFYAAHDAIQGVIDELTDVIGGAGAFALRYTRQATKPLLKALTSSSIAATSSAAMDFARVVILHLNRLIFMFRAKLRTWRGFQPSEGLTAPATLCIRGKTSCNSSLPAALNSFVAR